MGVPVATARGKAVDLDSGHSISCLGGSNNINVW